MRNQGWIPNIILTFPRQSMDVLFIEIRNILGRAGFGGEINSLILNMIQLRYPAEDLSRQIIILQGQNSGEVNEALAPDTNFKGAQKHPVIMINNIIMSYFL